MIKSIKYKNEEFSYPIFEFLYPYLIKLVWRQKLDTEVGGIVIINEESVDEFQLMLEELMIQLLNEFYLEPNEKDLDEYRGRYEQINLNRNIYNLNIATNGRDRIVYQIFSLFNWVKKVSDQD